MTERTSASSTGPQLQTGSLYHVSEVVPIQCQHPASRPQASPTTIGGGSNSSQPVGAPLAQQVLQHNQFSTVNVVEGGNNTSAAAAVPVGITMPTSSRQFSTLPSSEWRSEKKVGGRRYRMWTQLPVPPFPAPNDPPRRLSEVAFFPPDWRICVYDGNLTKYFEIPPSSITLSYGAVRYVEHYNEFGPYSSYRFQICHNFCCQKCWKGVECTYLHVSELPQGHDIHVLGVKTYECMPPGLSIKVYPPHSAEPVQDIPSDQLIVTQGAMSIFQSMSLQTNLLVSTSQGGYRQVQRPQHCAHFQFRRLCNRGKDCCFIHSLLPMPQPQGGRQQSAQEIQE